MKIGQVLNLIVVSSISMSLIGCGKYKYVNQPVSLGNPTVAYETAVTQCQVKANGQANELYQKLMLEIDADVRECRKVAEPGTYGLCSNPGDKYAARDAKNREYKNAYSSCLADKGWTVKRVKVPK